MLKTRVQNGSIYDWFTDEYKHKFEKVILRILKRDSMYNWSKCVKDGEELPENFQKAEHVLECGFVDNIIPRKDLSKKISQVLSILLKKNSEVSSENNEQASELSIQTREAS